MDRAESKKARNPGTQSPGQERGANRDTSRRGGRTPNPTRTGRGEDLAKTRGWSHGETKGLDTNGSQFFITYAKQPHPGHEVTPVFGRVIDGFETLDSLEKVPSEREDLQAGDGHPHPGGVTIHANPLAG
ncbi:peptidyl-prolyl cis-trans isomerase-like 3 [Babylonia areolata]|uniref:peptidyl-prolyl cis-trans isomerase-like 3 n=1 Tax=Babylonia areolata TaxID=304850 RepID=UPI003FD3BFC4